MTHRSEYSIEAVIGAVRFVGFLVHSIEANV